MGSLVRLNCIKLYGVGAACQGSVFLVGKQISIINRAFFLFIFYVVCLPLAQKNEIDHYYGSELRTEPSKTRKGLDLILADCL